MFERFICYKLIPSTYILCDWEFSPLRVLALGAAKMHRLRASENLRSNAQAPALTSLFLNPQTASKLPILPRLRHSPKPLPVKIFHSYRDLSTRIPNPTPPPPMGGRVVKEKLEAAKLVWLW